jgi:lysozyme family protein
MLHPMIDSNTQKKKKKKKKKKKRRKKKKKKKKKKMGRKKKTRWFLCTLCHVGENFTLSTYIRENIRSDTTQYINNVI